MDNASKIVYFKTFPRDELLDYRIQSLTLEEFGAYQKLKFVIAFEEQIPMNFKILGKLLGISAKKFERIWKNLNHLFIVIGENEKFIRHSELDAQRDKYNEFIENSRIGGLKSARLRGKDSSTNLARSVEATEQKQNRKKTEHNNDKGSLAEQATPETVSSLSSENSVSKKSNSSFSLETIREYVLNCQANGQTINNPVGLAITLHQTGKADKEIQSFLQSTTPKEKIFQCKKCESTVCDISTGVGGYCAECGAFSTYRFVETE